MAIHNQKSGWYRIAGISNTDDSLSCIYYSLSRLFIQQVLRWYYQLLTSDKRIIPRHIQQITTITRLFTNMTYFEMTYSRTWSSARTFWYFLYSGTRRVFGRVPDAHGYPTADEYPVYE